MALDELRTGSNGMDNGNHGSFSAGQGAVGSEKAIVFSDIATAVAKARGAEMIPNYLGENLFKIKETGDYIFVRPTDPAQQEKGAYTAIVCYDVPASYTFPKEVFFFGANGEQLEHHPIERKFTDTVESSDRCADRGGKPYYTYRGAQYSPEQMLSKFGKDIDTIADLVTQRDNGNLPRKEVLDIGGFERAEGLRTGIGA